MRLSFSGFENTLDITSGRVSILQIESVSLFTRICQSLFASNEDDRPESFTVWDDAGKEITSKNAFLFVVNPFNLPWRDRGLLTALYNQIDFLMKEDDAVRQDIEAAHQQLEHLVKELSLQLNSCYSFGIEWDLGQALKAYSFGIDRSDSVTLFDNLIHFIEFLHDICYRNTLVFVNIEKFLTKSELLELEMQLFFHNVAALFLVQGSDDIKLENARKLIIDQGFLESLE